MESYIICKENIGEVIYKLRKYEMVPSLSCRAQRAARAGGDVGAPRERRERSTSRGLRVLLPRG